MFVDPHVVDDITLLATGCAREAGNAPPGQTSSTATALTTTATKTEEATAELSPDEYGLRVVCSACL